MVSLPPARPGLRAQVPHVGGTSDGASFTGAELPLTLDAALRDATAARPAARELALATLAPAWLASIDAPLPTWGAARRGDPAVGATVVATLLAALAGARSGVEAGHAIVGLGMLGEPEALAAATAALEPADAPAARGDSSGSTGDPHAAFVRECAVIGVGLLTQCARASADDPDDELARRVARDGEAWLHAALDHPLPEVRFQAAAALADALDRAAEPALASALRREAQPRVRLALAQALALLGATQPETIAQLHELLQASPLPTRAALRDDPTAQLGFEAALALVPRSSPATAPAPVDSPAALDAVLVAAARVPELRDRALEALAAVAPGTPAPSADRAVPVIELLRALARGWLIAPVTRVRAAYALARWAPHEGLPALERLASSRRAAVREAVAEARALLEQG